MEQEKSVGVALVHLVSSALWPLVALLAIFMFKPYVETFLTAASSQVQKASKFKVGQVDITVSENALPKAPLRVGKIIPQMDNELMEYVLTTDPSGTHLNCYEGGATTTPSELADDGVLTRLQAMHMLTVTKLPKNYKDDSGQRCEGAVKVDYDQLFGETRTYYFDVLKQMKFSESK
ncbi:hypothetical protein [Caballeronia novacaledonica]|uniref:Uncharacterized protein n=1 Tax=Caballeronia novacaledonica TaxID=1544861 RepID=A0AA37MR10_9BURK|nr:hypothetical protein [Caballeronia novacaledonica]GJH23802.1 hypothetical protein CBA19CS42_04820 [Caballeronia novacaledonica]